MIQCWLHLKNIEEQEFILFLNRTKKFKLLNYLCVRFSRLMHTDTSFNFYFTFEKKRKKNINKRKTWFEKERNQFQLVLIFYTFIRN